MTVKVEIASDADATTWEDITDQMYLEGARWAGTASRGEIDTGSGFNWRNDDGTRIIPWRRRVRVTESAVAPGFVLWQGRTIGADRRRGPIQTGSASMFDVNLTDTNTDFGGLAFRSSRPAETDVDRISYLLYNFLQGQSRPSTVIGDTYFRTDAPGNLAAHLYEGIPLIEWFTHITETINREFFFTKDYDLFYNIPAATTYAATIAITDDGPDYSTSFPPILPEATEDATELFTGLRFVYANNARVNISRPAVTAANDIWTTNVTDESVTTAAAATARANKFLDEFDHSRTSFRCGVELPEDRVDSISWGMTISFRSAACGIFTPSTYRITRLSWELIGEGLWRADIELNYASKFGRASNPGTPPVVGPVPFTPSASVFQSATNTEQVMSSVDVTWPSSTGVGDLLVGCYAIRSHDVTGGPSGWSGHPSGLVSVSGGSSTGEMFYDLAASGSETTETFTGSGGDRQIATIIEFPGTWTLVDSAETTGTGGSFGTGSVTPTAGKRALIIGMYVQHATDFVQTITPDAGWTEVTDQDAGGGAGFEPHLWVGYRIVSSASGSYNPSGTSDNAGGAWGGQTLAFVTDDEPATPVQGQPVTETATGDGVTTSFTTSHPYAPGSLVVTVNGINVDDAVTETDPAAGTFTFDTAPPDTSEIVIRYLGAAP